jgi:hypothetical protein
MSAKCHEQTSRASRATQPPPQEEWTVLSWWLKSQLVCGTSSPRPQHLWKLPREWRAFHRSLTNSTLEPASSDSISALDVIFCFGCHRRLGAIDRGRHPSRVLLSLRKRASTRESEELNNLGKSLRESRSPAAALRCLPAPTSSSFFGIMNGACNDENSASARSDRWRHLAGYAVGRTGSLER